MSRAYNFCNNCGETGHAFHQCKKPITSIGIIVYKEVGKEKERQYLMICRKDTLGFVDFMRGKYHLHDANYIKNIIKEMTKDERERYLISHLKNYGKVFGVKILEYNIVVRKEYLETK